MKIDVHLLKPLASRRELFWDMMSCSQKKVNRRLEGIFLWMKTFKKCKAISVTGRGGLQGCEMSRTQNFLASGLTDGGKLVSPMLRPPITPQEDSWYSILLEAESIPGQ
jgi:hypothetical protein